MKKKKTESKDIIEKEESKKPVIETDVPGVKVVDGKLEIDEELLFWR